MMSGLTVQQMGRLKAVLEQQSEQLREAIRAELLRSDAESYGELAGRVHDTGDESVADLLADVNIAVISNHVQEVRAIEQALQRIAEGSYGICSDCEGAIDPARLERQPAALRCISCQERYERTHPGTHHPKL